MRNKSIDRTREIAKEVEQGRLPHLEATRLILANTTDGVPNLVAVGSAKHRNGLEPSVLMTWVNRENGEPVDVLRQALPTRSGGMRPMTRAMTVADLTLLSAVSNPNIPAERLIVGGLGITDDIDRGTVGWAQMNPDEPTEKRIHTQLYNHMLRNPDETAGYVLFVENDGFEEISAPFEPGGQYASPKRSGHEVVASFAVPTSAILSLPNIVEINYPVE